MDKVKRRQLIMEIISSGRIRTQRRLTAELRNRGLTVTQATVSRDLKEMAVVKRPDFNGIMVYSPAPRETDRPETKLARTVAEFARAVIKSGNLLVVKTAPGAAPTVAGSLDQAKLEGLLGTVAGDDTILLITRDEKTGKRIESILKGMLA